MAGTQSTMNAEAAPSLSVVEPDAGMKIVEMNLANAVLAIDIVPSTAKPSIRDIYVALRNQFGFQTSPIHVANFHTDFVIQFATPEERDRVLLHEFLHGRNFNMILIPWSRSYRSKIISWQTLVAIDVTNLPPHTCYPHCLQPLLSPHCKVLNYKFNKRVGACRAIAFALSASSIPSHGHVAVQYTHQDGVYNHAFPVAMQAYLHHQAPKFASDSSPCDSPVSPLSLDTAEELGVDREVLQEAYEEQHRTNQALENPQTNAGAAFYSSGSSLDSNYDNNGWESDRSWHLRYAE